MTLRGLPSGQGPGWPLWRADPAWKCLDFVSDLHLCSRMPRTFDAFADYLARTPADAVIILGDLFEVWVGDDVERDDFLTRCIDLLASPSRRHHLAFMPGNRDFLLGDTMLAACRMQGLSDPTLLSAWRRPVLLSHGDALCLDDLPYQAFRETVRSAAWQQAFLGLPLAERVRQARAMREHSEARQRSDPTSVDADEAACLNWLRSDDATDLVHGHTHRPADQCLAPGLCRHVLTDWDLAADPPRAGLLRLTAQGLQRLPIAPM